MSFSKLAVAVFSGAALLMSAARGQEGADPPAAAAEGCQSALTVLGGKGPAFVQVLQGLKEDPTIAPLVELLSSEKETEEKVTLFVPEDNTLVAAASQPPEKLAEVVATHAAKDEIMSGDIKDGLTVPTYGKNMLEFSTKGGPMVMVKGAEEKMAAKIVQPDLMSCSGPIHRIDKVLIPVSADGPAEGPEDMGKEPMMADPLTGVMSDSEAPGPATPENCKSLVDKLKLTDEQTQLLANISVAVLTPAEISLLSNPASNLTLLLPPEEDLLKLLGGFQQGKLTQENAVEVLKYHVLAGFYDSDELVMMDGDSVPTLAGKMETLMVEVDGTNVTFTANNTVSVIAADVDACSESQTIHKIDGVLIPDGLDVDIESFPPGDPGLLAAGLPPSGPEGPLNAVPKSAPGPSAAYGVPGIAFGMAVAALVATVAL